MSSRNKTAIAVAIAALALVGVLVAGCSMYRWAGVEPGEYTVVYDGAPATLPAAREIQKLEIDRESRLMALTLVDGSEIVASFIPRDRTEWPAGCPSNINSTRMEVLDIEPDPLAIGGATINHPILVRDCPPDPPRIVLREDGTVGGGGNACPHPQPCIFFAP